MWENFLLLSAGLAQKSNTFLGVGEPPPPPPTRQDSEDLYGMTSRRQTFAPIVLVPAQHFAKRIFLRVPKGDPSLNVLSHLGLIPIVSETNLGTYFRLVWVANLQTDTYTYFSTLKGHLCQLSHSV